VAYEPVAFDVSIRPGNMLVIRSDGQEIVMPCQSLIHAQRLAEGFDEDFQSVPWSVFCHPDYREHSRWLEEKHEEEEC